jgi:HSP20 family protein
MFSLIPWGKKRETERGAAALERFVPQKLSHPLQRMERDFDLLFNRLTSDWFGWPGDFFNSSQRWSMDVDDRADEVVVRAEVPGFEPDDIDVQLRGNCLCVSAEHRQEEEGPDGARHEYGSFRRMITLPQGIEADKVEARYHNGVLEVHLPKGEEARGKRIPIKA